MTGLESVNFGPNGRQTMMPSTTTPLILSHLVAPDTKVETNGASTAFELGAFEGKPVLIVLRVSRVIEQESLHVSIWGSKDGADWGSQALFWFPQKFYAGVSPAALDLGKLPGVKFLEARWEVNRWGRCDPRPWFEFGVEIQAL
jgi:hypothetical protein